MHLNWASEWKVMQYELAESFVVQFRASRYFIGLNQTSESKVMDVWICRALRCLIFSILIYHAPESDIWVKSYHHLNFLRVSVVQFPVIRYIIGLNRTFESKVMAVWICFVLPCLISSFSIYYVPESDIWVKSYPIWVSRELSLFNFEWLDILLAWIRHPSQKLWPFDLPCTLMFNFEHLDILCAWIGHRSENLWPFEFLETFRCLISSDSIYYWPESNIRVKSYGHLNFPCASMFSFEHLNILCTWIGHLSEKLWPYEFGESFRCSISSVSIYYWSGSDIRVKICGRLNLLCASSF